MDKDQDKRENLEEKKDPDIDKKEDNGQKQGEIEKDIESEAKDNNIINDQDPSKEASDNKDKGHPKEDTQKDLTKEETKEDKTSQEKEDIDDVEPDENKSEEIKKEDKDASDKQSEDKTESEDNKEEFSKSNSKESSTDERDQDKNKDTTEGKEGDDIESSPDEELWDTDSSLDDLDLDIFEDEDQELTEDDQDSKEVDKEDSKQDSLKTKGEGKNDVKNNEEEKDKDKDNVDNKGNKISKRFPSLKSLMFWGVIGLESLLIIIGFFTIYGLTSPYFNSNKKSPIIKQKHLKNHSLIKDKIKGSSRSKNTNSSNYPFDQNKIKLPSSAKVLGTAIISLQPFYIPVVYEGEVVFLKLHVTLTVSDPNTKAILEHRLSLIRNIIYENLKGIVISPSERGNFLLRYCKPLKQALNKQLAPYKITDITLMGFILK